MKKRTILLLALVAAAAAGIYGWSEYNRKPAGTGDAKADLVITADSLLLGFTSDENAANARFNEKVVEVSGKVRSVVEEGGKVNVTLETSDALAGVVCEFAPADAPGATEPGETLRIKGICTGYLIDVVLVRCSIVE
jgi:hypothetical protein